ncbi:multidrug effflux MFS transporter [Desulfatitalea alkaliphila]|uniref:Multidrug effflux MFS transporter n=1 Tax=Desulfatitalea alkaliphila TaxID=2929485 RepID=A0AA41UHX5_9BACT|nr:multidrug effflux MFS transporter [Desulfatitalea alkaliphila]MCJ8499469.1 multidrug effflux MFS transporter [Desulfatitalea alkaliphila]
MNSAPPPRPILLLLALLTAFPALSTDMYLPALPYLGALWDVPLVVVNFTLIGFFLSYCVMMLVYGPLSDRFGRRRPLLVGVGIFIAASGMCALAPDIHVLIAARVLQAAGAAAASALALAISKDLFESAQRARIMSYIAVIVALAPMLAPIIGGWVIHYVGWRWVFICQGGMGMIAWVGVFRMTESLQRFQAVSAREAVRVYFRLFRNRRYTGLLLAMSLLVFPFFAFIAGSPDIYMTRFGMDERQFGLFFGFNAFAFMCGPMAFSRLSRRVSTASLLTVAFAGIAISSLLMLIWPYDSPWRLALPMWGITFFLGMSRPPSNNLILDQVDRDVGAASALIIFTFMTCGAISMGLISLQWTDKIRVLSSMGAIGGTAAFLFWHKYGKRYFVA